MEDGSVGVTHASPLPRLMVFVTVVSFLLIAGLVPPPAKAQDRDLGAMYQAARYRALLQAQEDLRARPQAPTRVGSADLDSLRAWVLSAARGAEPAAEPAFPISDWKLVGRLERGLFEKRFGETPWSYLGMAGRSTLDTTRTNELRARMAAQFGPPTKVLADLKEPFGRPAGDYVQFEYWFVVNDSIPVVVMDANGPFDRGLVMASDARYRDQLQALRNVFLRPLVASDERAAYVDYFYDPEANQWYRTGFDGEAFFLEPIRRRRIIPGRRPWIAPADAPTVNSSP